MNNFLLLTTLLILLFTSCKKEVNNHNSLPITTNTNHNSVSSTNISIITGLAITEENGMQIGIVGNPNTKMPNTIHAFPSIPFGFFTIMNQDTINQIWIIPADPRTEFGGVDYLEILLNQEYSLGKLDSLSVIYSDLQQFSNTGVNVENLPNGFYRIFFQTPNDLYWDNIYINHDLTQQEKVNYLIELFNNP